MVQGALRLVFICTYLQKGLKMTEYVLVDFTYNFKVTVPARCNDGEVYPLSVWNTPFDLMKSEFDLDFFNEVI